MPAPGFQTLLVLSTPTGIPLWSARGITQSLEPIGQAAQLGRTVNGALVDLSLAQFRKYKSDISCSDFRTPFLNNLWPGQQLTVDCIPELNYLTAGGTPGRTVVPGSSRTEGGVGGTDYTYYRPRLTMRLISWTYTYDEWGAKAGWSMSLEEV